MVADGPWQLEAYLSTNETVEIFAAAQPYVSVIADVAKSVHRGMPEVSMSRQKLNTSVEYVSVQVYAKHMYGGWVGTSWICSAARFSTQWANPLWDLLD